VRDRALRIATGDAPIGEQIALPFGQELAELAGAFNSISDALRQEKEQLEDRIQERTLSLAHTNQDFQEDIAARLRAEEALQEKMGELDRFFSSVLDSLYIANVDGYFLRLNTVWETTLGYRLEDLEGKRFLDLVHPDDLEGTLDAIAELSADQQVLNSVNRYRCQDGSYRWIEWRSVLYQGRLIYAAARDITERRQMEETLRRQNQYLLSLQETSLDLITQLDLDHLLENIVRRPGHLMETSAGLLDLIELHGGQIEVTSQLNVGSTFRVLLPLANEPEI
jgi:PAS domain S-box-containing protein